MSKILGIELGMFRAGIAFITHIYVWTLLPRIFTFRREITMVASLAIPSIHAMAR